MVPSSWIGQVEASFPRPARLIAIAALFVLLLCAAGLTLPVVIPKSSFASQDAHIFGTAPLIAGRYVRIGGDIKYVRVGGAPLQVSTDLQPERDRCQNFYCSFGPGGARNDLFIVGWSDEGAGGEFGKYDATGWVSPCPPREVTHYRPPQTPGVICLRVTVDDIPIAYEPSTGQPVTTADDPPFTSLCTKVTVWDFTVEGPAPDWRPEGNMDGTGGNTTTLNIEILPATNHDGQSMAATFTVTL